ncbi:hypothetical protein Fcan01_05644 [Folsomia candida]|uniref:CUB domain-containing protein n=1 Tax=Folsomia candida TaxID=158441 RepID=A0A226ERX3_FOLCA|nr:hypothetical protein Fcan01_05644 [Folsomia candida]
MGIKIQIHKGRCASISSHSLSKDSLAVKMKSTESKTTRSSLLAYVSFSSADDLVLGFARKGGRLRPHSACDWTYDNCFNSECVVASPGYPGLFPPHRKCRFFLNANFTTDKIQIHFTAISFPPKPLCSTHHVAIWKRNVSSWGSPWKTLCQETDKISLEIDGGSAVIEFRSGATVSPYLYTGFRATVQFIHTGALVPTTEPSHSLVQNPKSETGRVASPGGKARRPLSQHQGHPAVSRKTVHLPITPSSNNYGDDDDDEEDDDDDDDEDEEYSGPVMGSPRAPYDANGVHQITCGHTFDGSSTRGTVFRLLIPKDLRQSFVHQTLPSELHASHTVPNKPSLAGFVKCQLEFRGKVADVVQLAIFNYRLRGSSCSSYMEVYDMAEVVEEVTNQTDHHRLLGDKLCGPSGNEVKVNFK